MGALGASNAIAVRLRSQAQRARAEKLRRDAATSRSRTDALAERLATRLLEKPHRPHGDRGDQFLLRLGRLGRLRPLLRFARNDLRRWLESQDLPPEVVDDATLACSEACANALEHPERATRQLVEVAARREDAQLVVSVRDYGCWSEHDRSDFRGRGISMTGHLMDGVDIRHHPDGTEIVMRRRLLPARARAPRTATGA